MRRGYYYHVLFIAVLVHLFARHSDCFQWTRNQQFSHVIDAKLGSDVSISCEFLLTSDEESAMKNFYLIYWSRETPAGSQSWQGIAARSNLISNSRPTIIHRVKSHFAMKGNTLTIFSVQMEDEGQYQCEVKSSFYTTPNLIKLKLTKTQQPYDGQKSPLSNGASAGIGVGVTLAIVGFIAVVAILWMIRRKKEQVGTQATKRETKPRNDAAEAYVGPACPADLNGNDEAVENEYSTSRKNKCTTQC